MPILIRSGVSPTIRMGGPLKRAELSNATLSGGRRNIITTLLTGYENNVDQNSYTTTASISPVANALTLLWVSQTATAANGPTSFSGAYSGNWTLVRDRANAGTHRLSCYRALTTSTPTPGQVTVNFASGDTTNGVHIFVTQHVDIDTSGSNGSGAIASILDDQQGANSSVSFSLSPFENNNNVMAYAISIASASAVPFTVGSGFTLLSELAHAAPGRGVMVAKGNAGIATANPSWSISANGVWVVVQLKAGLI